MITTALALACTLAAAEAGVPQPAATPPIHLTVRATLVVRVADSLKSTDELVALAEAAGGYFSARTNEALTVRIPTAAVEAFIKRARELGRVLDENHQALDQTRALEEMETSLRSREETLERYFAVLAEARPEAVVVVEREMSRLITEIETIKGRLKLLASELALATVSIHFNLSAVPRAPAPQKESPFRWINTLGHAQLLSEFAHVE